MLVSLLSAGVLQERVATSQKSFESNELHASMNSTEKFKMIGRVDNSLILQYYPGFELEISGFDTILSCMHRQPIQLRSLS